MSGLSNFPVSSSFTNTMGDIVDLFAGQTTLCVYPILWLGDVIRLETDCLEGLEHTV